MHAPLLFLSTSQRCSRNRPPNLHPVSPMYNVLNEGNFMQLITLVEMDEKRSMILIDRLDPHILSVLWFTSCATAFKTTRLIVVCNQKVTRAFIAFWMDPVEVVKNYTSFRETCDSLKWYVWLQFMVLWVKLEVTVSGILCSFPAVTFAVLTVDKFLERDVEELAHSLWFVGKLRVITA